MLGSIYTCVLSCTTHSVKILATITSCICSVSQSHPTLCDPTDCSMPGFLVLPHLLEFSQTQVYWVDDAIQPSQLVSFPSLPAFNPSQHQGLFQWVTSLHQVAKVLELQHIWYVIAIKTLHLISLLNSGFFTSKCLLGMLALVPHARLKLPLQTTSYITGFPTFIF